MTDMTAVKASIGNLAAKIKQHVDGADAEIVGDIDQMVEDLHQQVVEEIAKFGQDSGDQFQSIYERFVDLGAGSEIDCWQANHFGKTITANTTFTFKNVPSAGKVFTAVLRLTNPGAFTLNFPSSVRWTDGTKPTFTAAGRDNVALSTVDGGATWDAYLIGRNMKVPT